MPMRLINKVRQSLKRKSAEPAKQPDRTEHADASKSTAPSTAPRPRQARSRKPAAEAAKAWSLDDFQVAPVEGQMRFHDIDLPLPLMHAIHDLGFEYCTPVQARTMPPALLGRNVAGRAQTGTGKTAAFLLSMFTRFLRNPPVGRRPRGAPRALVIAPTRELVVQIVKDATDLGGHAGLRSLAIYGGMDYVKQQRDIEAGPLDLVAATPGRLIDFLGKRVLDIGHTEALVIDEADRMLDMGFIPDVRRIIRKLPPRDRRQTMLFSATLTRDVLNLASQWMPDPLVIEVEPEQVAAENVGQIVYPVTSAKKFPLLYNLLLQPEMTRVLIFANRRDRTQGLADALQRHGVPCDLLSGDVPQNKRLRILDDFREGRTRIVVATDVAGRGLHVENISHVVNYELPYEAEDYVHRIGRTGRAGAKGIAISFACEDESFIIPEIEEYVGEPLSCVNPEEALLAPPPRPSRPAARREQERRPARGGSRSSGPSRHSRSRR